MHMCIPYQTYKTVVRISEVFLVILVLIIVTAQTFDKCSNKYFVLRMCAVKKGGGREM
jgi:hypothetical protein